MAELAVTAVGADRPGIIARVTGVLLEHGGNLEDCAMTILSGQFAIMLLVRTDTPAADLEQALVQASSRDLGLVVAVREVGPGARSAPPTHVLSVYGTDRPGLLHAVTRVLAERGINVTDLTTRVLDGAQPVYAMLLELSLPPDQTPEEVLAAIRAGVEGVDASINPLDVATF